MKPLFFLILTMSLLIAACNKEQYYKGSDPVLKFSADTISFDTVFTTIGTATQRLMVYNPYDKILKISAITLAGGSTSPFSLNVDGVSGNSVTDLEIHPRDSLYIFIQVLINPTGQNLPLFVRDSIVFTVNQTIQNVKLVAYGQDVHLIKNQTLKTQTWPADKPYLIYGNVTVDSLQTLTITQGATVYFHKLANLLVKGTLIANGDLPSPIVFQGDRLEREYNDIPGQWGGVYFRPGSKNNQMNYVIIRNGTNGIQLGDYDNLSMSDLQISNTIIRTMSYNSLFAIDATIKAVNCVIADAGMYSCGLVGGGDYEFYHCTLANYYGLYAGRDFSGATLKITNYYTDSTGTVTHDLMNASFYNSIVYGNMLDELVLDQKDGALFQYKFDHCLIRSKTWMNSTDARFDTVSWNKDPEFKFTPNTYLELDTLSPAKDAGNVQIGKLYPLDLKKINRTLDKGPDLGAYERVEK